MKPLTMRRIDLGKPGGKDELRFMMQALGNQGNVVSARGRELTRKVFGEDLTPIQVVEKVCADVASKGIQAALHYTKQFDQAEINPASLRVSETELQSAHRNAKPALMEAVRRIRQNVLAFQSQLLQKDSVLSLADKGELRLRLRPIRRVGIHIPGGAAAYPSTLLMTVVPAQAAGVAELAVIMPPTANGANSPDMLAVCHELGVKEVYRIGGAQGIAALAYGMEGLPRVDMIVGPGNMFVALAKKTVYGQVSIDCIAGPSEVVVLADENADPVHLAAELISQAEHSPGSSLLVTWNPNILEAVQNALRESLAKLERGDLAQDCLERFGAFVVAPNEQEAIATVNQLAPEHLHIDTASPQKHADLIDNAGAIFVGPYSPVAAGDYAAGPSHVLPTGGTARFASGLCANDFLRRSSVIHLTEKGLSAIAPDICTLADLEGLTGHKASVTVRLKK